MITGAILIGNSEHQASEGFEAVDPATGRSLEPRFAEAGAADVTSACGLAEQAFPIFSELAPDARAAFLERVADAIDAIGDPLIIRAMSETGLPRARLEGERGRTMGQLRMFAAYLRRGDWVDATIDPALPDRSPMPRADLRRRNVALGPVAVFGASNFPLAFSVAGGDTAAAFAAGCPVVVKGHPAHPGTGELVARAIRSAVAESGLPEGVFSYLPGRGTALGAALVADPRIKAVGFTGSRAGGLALMQIAAQRAEPIPVYAEMSSINPVLLFPAALAARAETLGQAFVQSLSMGAGQFCTNPGLVLALDGPDLDRFKTAASEAMTQSAPGQMLTAGIHDAYARGVATLDAHSETTLLARGVPGEGACGQGALFETSAEAFLGDAALGAEVFGAASLLVRCRDTGEMASVLQALEGQLTATLHIEEADHPLAANLVPLLARKAGRVLANGWPTGVEVTHAMVHGGPYPATSDGRSTSVGTLAITRFLRPVCYQDLPDALLPDALKSDNPLGLPRWVDGERA
ncbi:MAG: aldehyde dehydrogenase (NADP(+)) [Sphingomonas sp.]|nr:aldehyde dehydrogenase (NADP(+)) [Sphingomonas sp.]